MTPIRPPHWLLLAGILVPVTLALGWLLLGLGGDRGARQPLERVVLLSAGYTGFDPMAVAAQPESAWQPWTGRGFVRGAVPVVRWVRVTLPNPGPRPVSGVLVDVERYADRVDLYLPDATGGWRHLRSGEWTPAAEKALWGRETAFPLTVPAHGTLTAYLRYEDRIALWFEFGWWPEARAFHARVLREFVAESAYFGALLALLLYHAVLWLQVRLPHTGGYLLYLGTFIVFVFLARNEAVLLGLPLGSPVLETALTSALALSGACLAGFSRRFLELPERLPRADRVARAARLVMALLAAAALVAPVFTPFDFFSVIVLGSTATHVVLFALAIMAWRAGAGQARYFMLAFGFLLAGLAPLLVSWIPGMTLEMVGRLVMTGSVLEMLVLSVAIAERFAGLQREKIAAQTQAMAEADRRQAIQEAYADELEHEVRARTGELAAANADKDCMMTVLGHDLRSPLTTLTLSAEQLVADQAPAAARASFAAGVTQTGRALLLLLEDIVLWARLRAGRGKVADHLVASLVAPATELHRTEATARGLELAVTVGPELRVRTDLILAQTLVRNLISHAVKTAARRIAVTTTLVSGGRVRIAVGDDGPGPSAAMANLRPAKPFSATPWQPSGNLGLTLCGEIAQAMGTELVVQSAVRGTEIAFTLPAAGG